MPSPPPPPPPLCLQNLSLRLYFCSPPQQFAMLYTILFYRTIISLRSRKLFRTLGNKILLWSSPYKVYQPSHPPCRPFKPVHISLVQKSNSERVQRCASTLSLRQSFYLAFKMHISTIIPCIALLARGRGSKLPFTALLFIPSFPTRAD